MMSAIYGDLLYAFTELMLPYTIFHLKPLAGGGFTDRKDIMTVQGYVSRDSGGRAGTPDGTFAEGQEAKFYCFDSLPASSIRQGMYIEDNGEVFKFIQDNNYAKTGGFAVYSLMIFTGVTDMQVPNRDVERNILNNY
jgi:hypothetical protein